MTVETRGMYLRPFEEDYRFLDKPAGNFEFLHPMEFLQDLEMAAKNARGRVWAKAMYTAAGDITNSFMDILEMAALKGIDTRLQLDSYVDMATDGYPNYMIDHFPLHL